MKKILLLLILVVLSYCKNIEMFCYKVVDGDTVYGVTPEGDTVKVRLWGVDCPERGQPYGDSATQFVREYCEGQELSLQTKSRDRYGRTVAVVYTPTIGKGGKKSMSLNLSLVMVGFAWWSERIVFHCIPQEILLFLR